MLKQYAAAVFISTLAAVPALAASSAALTATEIRWLKAAGPVLAYAQRAQLPVDIIVQPVASPNDVPLAMGFMNGRCKLVLSMRGNPDAEKVLEKVPAEQHAVLMEAMAAHEIGHCWRYAKGTWHVLPSGFEESGEEHAADPSLLAAAKTMRENRREEGFADMVALAWTKRHHPTAYAQVYQWLANIRAEVAVPGSGHDTRAWVRLAGNPAVFPALASPFLEAVEPWERGLLSSY